MKIAVALSAAVLLLAGCGGSSDGEAPADAATTAPAPAATSAGSEPTPSPDDGAAVVDITIKDGTVTPQGGRVEAKVGGKITLRITSDADEEIHVHSEPEHTYEVAAGDSVTESFTVDAPGQVAVEAHHLDVTIVQLVVRP